MRIDVDMSALVAQHRFTGIASDSREVRPGYLFAAIPGAKANGAVFIADAASRGAIAVLGAPEIADIAREYGMVFYPAANPRLALAHLAAAFFAAQPATVAAVTGTNGKTSVTVFLRHIWTALGKSAASLGTIGALSPAGEIKLSNTTPGPVELHQLLARLAGEGVSHLAMEASSHGLDQARLDGVKIQAAGFTNLTRDHLDYHPSFEAYRDAKCRLFSELVGDGGVAVINADADYADAFIAASEARKLELLTVGEKGLALQLVGRTPHGDGQELTLRFGGQDYRVNLPLAGGFQASNALVAAGLAIGLGEDPSAVFAALESVKGAPGRLEKMAVSRAGAPIYVDYAHTPDALEVVLKALRPHTRAKLVVVFGCGGDRDKGKRPLMGKAAITFADKVIVTDDNPRSEEAAAIRQDALAGCPGAIEIGDRAEAIRSAVAALGAGDVLVIAGKGHEAGQIIKGVVHPFSDREEALAAALATGGHA
ncbi:MAG: UDP-N-acetylmuramoyl-L-alanyl-D-glutamate--2,6-diaminopimelate ligase [Rhizomicrobium sp.]